MTHITIVCVTLYLHRGQTHKALEFHPALAHFFRFWLWFTTGMVTKEWVAVHRMHHANVEEESDPHSPHHYGILKLLYAGAFLYHNAARDKNKIEQYGKGTPDDWVERHIYSRRNLLGILLLLVLNLIMFDVNGLIIWLVQMIWIPFWAAGIVNGIGHWWGYRNWNTKDKSANIIPLGIIIGGEELHNNHHKYPASPKLSRKWFEFDIGWMWIKLFSAFNLITIKEFK
jgi:stearoyl-CoA desaturase (delta-9 desaturase)